MQKSGGALTGRNHASDAAVPDGLRELPPEIRDSHPADRPYATEPMPAFAFDNADERREHE